MKTALLLLLILLKHLRIQGFPQPRDHLRAMEQLFMIPSEPIDFSLIEINTRINVRTNFHNTAVSANPLLHP